MDRTVNAERTVEVDTPKGTVHGCLVRKGHKNSRVSVSAADRKLLDANLLREDGSALFANDAINEIEAPAAPGASA